MKFLPAEKQLELIQRGAEEIKPKEATKSILKGNE